MSGYYVPGFACTGNCIKKQGYAIAVLDLMLANISVLIGFVHVYSPLPVDYIEKDWEWDILTLKILQEPLELVFSTELSENILVGLTLVTFAIEACLFILLIQGNRKLDGKRLRIWFRIRLLFFFLVFICLVIRTINSRTVADPYIILEQGALGIIYMIYRGYGLLVVTFLEELAYKSLTGNIYRLV